LLGVKATHSASPIARHGGASAACLIGNGRVFWPSGKRFGGVEVMPIAITDFFVRKIRIIILTILTYAALC
jgi:hypothetical protein